MYNKYLEIFIEVADTGSFTKASEKFFISPTAVMKQINNMENDLGLKLIERNHSGASLTKAGKKIYTDCKYIIDYSNKAIQEARQLQNKKNKLITIGTSVICDSRPLMNLWYKVSDKFPEYRIKIVPFESNHTTTLTTLKNSSTDFDAIVSPCDSPEWLKNVNFLKLGTYKYTILVPRNHRLAGLKKASLKDLSNETVMTITEGDSKQSQKIYNLLQTNENITIKSIPFFYDINVFNECEENGYVLISLNAWKDVHPSLVNIPLKESIRVDYGIVYPKNPSSDLKDFIEIINSVK